MSKPVKCACGSDEKDLLLRLEEIIQPMKDKPGAFVVAVMNPSPSR